MSLQDLLKELQKEYLGSFPEKIANLEALLKSGQLDDLTTEYHKLKGTGRTYGLPEVTQLGELLESIAEHDAVEDPAGRANRLQVAVPVSLRILERIRLSRTTTGEEYALDTDPDFLLILSVLPKSTKSAGGGWPR